MRISDWSSDVCSSDLLVAVAAALMTHPETGWLRDVSGSPSAWALLSRFLPVAAILPIALGFMLMLGVGVGAYNVEFGFSLFAPMTALALVWVTVRIGRVRSGERRVGTECVRQF